MSDMLNKAKSTKWGVVGILAVGAGLVAADCLDFKDPVVQGVAETIGGAIGGGLVLLVKKFVTKFTTPAAPAPPPV
jgi:hypothetical protein